MAYRFVQTGSFFGSDAESEMSALLRAQFFAMLEDSGETATSMREWCEQVGRELDQDPSLAGFETWDGFEDDVEAPRFTLLYFGDSDSGLLFHAGTARAFGLALWPEGFKPKPEDAVITGVDVSALTTAWEER